ncbi:MAG TPA: biliverdin-producing heme oxygenase [Acidimicrobiales bacterium]|nr:biliverdin-producing heme oxygenase [Acidimicrobiales bacterium]
MSTTLDDGPDQRFSTTLRERTMADHGDAEGSTLMGDLMAGTLERARIGDMLAQHLIVYRALERTAETFRGDPVVAPFLSDDLARTPALEHDVAALLGAEAVAAPTPRPATAAYVARIEGTTDWPGGFVAHHYTRYLGDLSGGQHIGRVVARAYADLDVRFYTFDRIASPKAVKEAYRAQLDRSPWSDEERERIIDEVRVAYALNTDLFRQLDQPA